MMDAVMLARIFVCAFFAACMIQSGLDKIFDWKGNLDWLTGHFGKSFLRSQVPMMLATVTLLEVVAGFACLASVFVLIFKGPMIVPIVSLSLICLDLLMLFTGQRIAKDYAGAASLAGYFIVALLGLTLMASA
ncbi:MAG: DoxX family protein [Fimbriimonadales bacterium]